MDVSGSVRLSGELTLSGTERSMGRVRPETQLTEFTGRLNGAGELTGELTIATRFEQPPALTSPVVTITADIEPVLRGPAASDSSFTGDWIGGYVVRDCSVIGWSGCYPEELNEPYGFRLSLAQTGSAVSGTLDLRGAAFPITGTVETDTLTISGVGEERHSGGRSFLRIAHWTTRRDRVGRMTGSFGYVRETIWEPPIAGRPNYESRYNVELVSGLLLP